MPDKKTLREFFCLNGMRHVRSRDRLWTEKHYSSTRAGSPIPKGLTGFLAAIFNPVMLFKHLGTVNQPFSSSPTKPNRIRLSKMSPQLFRHRIRTFEYYMVFVAGTTHMITSTASLVKSGI